MDAELQYEQQRVDTVREKLSRRLADLKKELGDVKSHMVEIPPSFLGRGDGKYRSCR